jgi:hypothetical protein
MVGESKITDLSQLKLARVAYEVRYDQALLIWDKAGSIWTEIRKRFPGLAMAKAEPNGVVFKLGDKYELSVGIDRAVIIASLPARELIDFARDARQFVAVLQEGLSLKEYTRIGLRSIFVKEYDSVKGASAAIMTSGILSPPKDKVLGVEGDYLAPQVILRRESESRGFRVEFKVENKRLEIEANPDAGLEESIVKEQTRLVLDVDCYTLKTVGADQLSPDTWIADTYHSVKRDGLSFLGR